VRGHAGGAEVRAAVRVHLRRVGAGGALRRVADDSEGLSWELRRGQQGHPRLHVCVLAAGGPLPQLERAEGRLPPPLRAVPLEPTKGMTSPGELSAVLVPLRPQRPAPVAPTCRGRATGRPALGRAFRFREHGSALAKRAFYRAVPSRARRRFSVSVQDSSGDLLMRTTGPLPPFCWCNYTGPLARSVDMSGAAKSLHSRPPRRSGAPLARTGGRWPLTLLYRLMRSGGRNKTGLGRIRHRTPPGGGRGRCRDSPWDATPHPDDPCTHPVRRSLHDPDCLHRRCQTHYARSSSRCGRGSPRRGVDPSEPTLPASRASDQRVRG